MVENRPLQPDLLFVCIGVMLYFCGEIDQQVAGEGCCTEKTIYGNYA